MCGIVGVCGETKFGRRDVNVRQALASLTHRGPDDRGIAHTDLAGSEIILGQTRLAVIDLSPAGHQPMVSSDGRFTLVYNGEIYNYRELRTELEAEGATFVSHSDTEVLLMAWERWGRSCIRRLRGMFAFAVLDSALFTLTCVRDAFGIKPFHYTQLEGGGFAFASEIQALVDLIGTPVGINHRQVFRYLEFGFYDESEESFFDGVNKLRPGSLLVYDIAKRAMLGQQRWWWPEVNERTDLSFADASVQLRELILESVSLHLRSDVPLGTALSGGIDSSVIVGAMRKVAPDAELHTFSYVARESSLNEEVWIDRMNAAVRAVPHKVVATQHDLVRDLEAVIRTQGEPFGSTSIYAQYRVFQAAREAGVTVTLDGQGADELLAGYAGYPAQRIRSLLSRLQVSEAVRFLNAWSEWPGRTRTSVARGILSQTIPRPVVDPARVWLSSRKFMPPPEGVRVRLDAVARPRPPRGRHLAAGLRDGITERGLEALLRHADRNSMAFSVESRVPFLNTDIADFLLSLPEDYLVSPEGQTKRVLREAMKGIVPEEILQRRDKIGFETPQHDWIRHLAPDLDSWLAPMRDYPFLDTEYVLEKVNAWLSGHGTNLGHDSVWRLLNFCRWLEILGPRLRL